MRPNAECRDVLKYDSDFVLCLPGTVVKKELLSIFKQSRFTMLRAESPEKIGDIFGTVTKEDPQKDTEKKSDFLGEQPNTQTAAQKTTQLRAGGIHSANIRASAWEIAVAAHEVADEAIRAKADPFLMVKSQREYRAAYTAVHELYAAITKNNELAYKDVQKMVYGLVRAVQKNPVSFLMIGEIPVPSNANPNTDLALRYLLFTLALFEETQLRKFFYGIDKRVNIAVCAFLSRIGSIVIAKELQKPEAQIDFTASRIQERLPGISAAYLKRKFFPSFVVDVVSRIKPFNPEATTYQYRTQMQSETDIAANLISLSTHFVKAATVDSTPFEILKAVTGNRFNYMPNILTLFAQLIGPIPIGSYVRLANNAYGLAFSASHNPQAPYVFLITDRQGEPRKTLTPVQTFEDDFKTTGIAKHETVVRLREIYKNILANYG